MGNYTDLLDKDLLSKIYDAGYELNVENNAHDEGITFSFKKRIGHYLIYLNTMLEHDNGISITIIEIFEEELGNFPARYILMVRFLVSPESGVL